MAHTVQNMPARATEVSPGLQSGYAAQGWSLAQTAISIIKSHHADYGRLVRDAWPLSTEARNYARKTLASFVKDARERAKLTHPVEGIKPETWQRIANSATVRLSQYGVILKAMDAGMTLDTLSKSLQVPDPENVSFDTVLTFARTMVQADANRGRKQEIFLLKLAKWLSRNAPALPEKATDEQLKAFKKDKKDYDKVIDTLGETLPKIEEDKDEKKPAAKRGRPAKKAPKAEPTPTPELVEQLKASLKHPAPTTQQ